jgi:hypothetical protein
MSGVMMNSRYHQEVWEYRQLARAWDVVWTYSSELERGWAKYLAARNRGERLKKTAVEEQGDLLDTW